MGSIFTILDFGEPAENYFRSKVLPEDFVDSKRIEKLLQMGRMMEMEQIQLCGKKKGNSVSDGNSAGNNICSNYGVFRSCTR